MPRVLVTVQRSDESTVRDLELPADLEAAQLAELIRRALRWDIANGGADQFRIEASPPGRLLADDETLAGVNAWDGSRLRLHPLRVAFVAPDPAPAAGGAAGQASTASPVANWRALGIDLPSASTERSLANGNGDATGSKYTWKRIDQ